jgi:hypothetical protein
MARVAASSASFLDHELGSHNIIFCQPGLDERSDSFSSHHDHARRGASLVAASAVAGRLIEQKQNGDSFLHG